MILFKSTDAGSTLRLGVSAAMLQGLAPDGRLFVPMTLPKFEPEDFEGLTSAAQLGPKLLAPFFEGDPLEDKLKEICEEAFNFPLPLKELTRDTAVLELFHGPTAAFKDIGARFLASCLSRTSSSEDGRPLTILVATSGDTGGAVAAAFWKKPNVEVFVLYPKDGVSARQERQLTCWQDNITTLAVDGVFDDCQRLVKAAFAHPWWQENKRFSSANSINVGRLLPQMVYYASASLEHWRRHKRAPSFIIPSGNLGNACAAVWARACGLPIKDLILATNANLTITDYFERGQYSPRPSQPTLASAMDVGNPSNMERLRHIYPSWDAIKQNLRAYEVDDARIRDQIKRGLRVWQEIWCPHTACAVEVRERLDEDDMIIVSTAHPAKFDIIVEPLIEQLVPIPKELAKLLDAPNYALALDDPSVEALTALVQARQNP